MADVSKLVKALRQKTQYELAHETAQKNAVEMLGLPPDNTAMDRAKALGYTNELYHGTSKDVPAFDINMAKGKQYDTGAWLTNNPDLANTYTLGINGGNVMPLLAKNQASMVVDAKGKSWNRLGKQTKVSAPKITVQDNETDDLLAQLGIPNNDAVTRKAFSKTLGKMFPDEFKYDDYFTTDDLARYARKQGYDATEFNNIVDIGPSGMFVNEKSGMPSNNIVVYKPENVRSRFAAFDPARINEADLLGYATPAMMGTLAAGSGAGILAANKSKSAQLAQAIKSDNTLKAPDRSKLLGMLADALKPVQQYASKVNIPIVDENLADLTGLTGTQSLADDMSYGKPLFSGGSLQTSQIDPRAMDAASLTPVFAGPAKSMAKKLIKMIGK